jgi:MFS transporter, DHA1 family, multidrug resistance protein
MPIPKRGAALTAAERLPVRGRDIGFKQFVAMVAALMAMNALSVDIMLPALGVMGDALHFATANQRQWIVTSYLVGFGGAQLIYGPLSDRFGRKPVLLFGIGLYISVSLAAALAQSFEILIAARMLQGVGAAATRVLAVSIARDRFSGRQMARVLSLAMLIFLAVPMMAPAIGQLILLVAPWRWIFGALAGLGLLLALWVTLNLPETLRPEHRRPVSYASWLDASRFALTNRWGVGYMLAMICVTGGNWSYLSSAQQIFVDRFGVGVLFPLLFAINAGCEAIGSLFNARIVGSVGTRIISQAAMFGLLTMASLHAVVACLGYETLVTFCIFQASMTICTSLMAANFSAMAMQPMAHIAGAAASIQGFCTTIGAVLISVTVGQSFDGTTMPLAFGYLAIGTLIVVIVFITERGRLFRPTDAQPAP